MGDELLHYGKRGMKWKKKKMAVGGASSLVNGGLYNTLTKYGGNSQNTKKNQPKMYTKNLNVRFSGPSAGTPKKKKQRSRKSLISKINAFRRYLKGR